VPALARPASGKAVLFAGLGAVVLVVLGALGWVLTRPGVGYILVDLQGVPAKARGQVQVRLDTQLVPLEGGSPTLLREVTAGQVMVMVSAEHYNTFTKTVEVTEGKDVARVQVVLESLERKASLMLDTEPVDAEVKVDGKVVRAQGRKDRYIKDVPLTGDEWTVELSAPEHKPVSLKVAVSGDEPVEVSHKLEPKVKQVEVTVESKPAGAAIFANGRDLGMVTPATVKVPADSQLSVKLRCHDEAEVDVPQAESGEGPAPARVSLKKQRNCR
jgi:hypothetical protein